MSIMKMYKWTFVNAIGLVLVLSLGFYIFYLNPNYRNSGAVRQPASAQTNLRMAYSIDPPSNVRAATSTKSAILCSVNANQPIPILGMQGNWYKTNVCGTVGYIYRNQVRY